MNVFKSQPSKQVLRNCMKVGLFAAKKTLQGYSNRTDECTSVQEPTRKGYGNTSRDTEISARHLLTQSLVLATWESLKLNQWCCEIVEILQTLFEQSQQLSGPT